MTTGAPTPAPPFMEPRGAGQPGAVQRPFSTERKRPLRSHWVLFFTLLTAGCGPFTFPLTFSPTATTELPTTGRVVWVTVSDERLGDSSTWLGVVRTGDVVGDYVLQGGDSVALRMTRDLVAALRSKGYRAYESGAPHQPSEGTFLQIRIIRLAATVYAAAFQTPKWQWSSAFVCRSGLGTSREPLWADFVYTSETRSIPAASRKREQEAVEGFYHETVNEVVRQFTTAVPP
jgi:hypothetical protein